MEKLRLPRTYLLILFILLLYFSRSGKAQEGCTIIKGNCPPSDLTPTCATTVVNGVLGAYVYWSQPTFSLSCPGGGPGYDFVMSYDLNESLSGNECWLYSKVQRIGTSSGQLRLWQSTQSNSNPNPNFTTPTFFLPDAPVNGSMSITNGSGNNFTVNIYLIAPNGTMSGINTSVSVTGSGEYLFTITSPGSGAYRLFFEFVGNGRNSDYVDNLKLNAPLFGTACSGDINFSITSDHVPGEFFPVGVTPVTYTATCNSCIPVLVETCTFNVVVNGVTATVTPNNATCGQDFGSATLIATSSNDIPALQYNLDNTGWTNFTSPVTIPDLTIGTHVLNVRDYFSNISANCQILDPLSFSILRETDVIPPVISCPANQNITGCDLSVTAESGLPYSTVPTAITLDQFTALGATATDNCSVSSWQYQDTVSGTCPIILTRTFTVSDPNGNTASCNQLITISELQIPTLSVPSQDFCVKDLDFSVINDPRTDITSRPDWYTVVKGSTELDIVDYEDNCAPKSELSLRWRIDFADGTSISGAGQVSAYSTDIQLPGQEGANLTHHITYWVTDKCGNEAQNTATITIHPRPQINKNTT